MDLLFSCVAKFVLHRFRDTPGPIGWLCSVVGQASRRASITNCCFNGSNGMDQHSMTKKR